MQKYGVWLRLSVSVLSLLTLIVLKGEPWAWLAFSGIALLARISESVDRLVEIEDAYLEAAED